jgi:hypothetical protein
MEISQAHIVFLPVINYTTVLNIRHYVNFHTQHVNLKSSQEKVFMNLYNVERSP